MEYDNKNSNENLILFLLYVLSLEIAMALKVIPMEKYQENRCVKRTIKKDYSMSLNSNCSRNRTRSTSIIQVKTTAFNSIHCVQIT
jgi:hypothetical protein